MTKKRWKRVMALIMALVLTVGAAIPTAVYANADGTDADAAVDIDGDIQADMEPEPALYDETAGTEVESAEIVEPAEEESRESGGRQQEQQQRHHKRPRSRSCIRLHLPLLRYETL